MKITPDQLVQNLADSGLMSADEASSLCSGLSTVTGPTDVDTVIQELVGSGKLTAFQAECICRGEIAGLVVDEYVVLDKIGQGGMGVVLKAYHGRLDRLAAVKKLPREKMDTEDAVERFHREAKAAARLSHPNVVTVYDAREHDGIHYLIMEYVEGQDLAQLVSRQGSLPVAEAADYVIQAARGLQYAHDEGIVHRDIKPSNLLLDAKGQIKILDMGLALIQKGTGPPGAASLDQLTTDGQVMGTCDYMAPEQAKNTHDVDRRADIYSLGCTLYRLLTGEPPYRGDSLLALLLAHQEAEIPSLCDKRPDVPHAVDTVYHRMVAKTVGDRYQSMTEVIFDLESVAPGSPSPIRHQDVCSTNHALTSLFPIVHKQESEAKAKDIGPTIELDRRASEPNRRWLVIGGGVAACLAVVGLAFAFWPDGSGEVDFGGGDDPVAEKSETINLLALIDVERDQVAGEWKKENGVLITPTGNHDRIRIPFVPPLEYEIELVAERKGGRDALMMGLVGEGRQFMAVVDGHFGSDSSLQNLDGTMGRANETTKVVTVLLTNQRTHLRYRVTGSGVSVTSDGKGIIDWNGDFDRLSLVQTTWGVGRGDCLFVVSYRSTFHIHSMTLTPITGQGRILYPDTSDSTTQSALSPILPANDAR